MSTERWSTHGVRLGPAVVTKRFRSGDREGAGREWRALTLLGEYAPGLAPDPLAAELAAERPTVAMSRLPGTPLRGRPLADGHVKALAAALNTVHAAVPPGALSQLPLRPGLEPELVAHIHSWYPAARPRAAGDVARAMDLGTAWLAGVPGPAAPLDVPAVFGSGDGNLANYLWDGSRVRVVDFEDSGRSDRAFELAEITEHVGSWVDHPLDVDSFLGHVDLTAAESARLTRCRRLLALVWLFLLLSDDGDPPRNPPGTAERQAVRLLELLG
jgi:Ser/Thr protein kinase RdoA (MazF antagonist)